MLFSGHWKNSRHQMRIGAGIPFEPKGMLSATLASLSGTSTVHPINSAFGSTTLPDPPGALELVDRLFETYKGKPLEQFSQNLHNQIGGGQGTLQDLIEKLGKKESPVRKAGAWVARRFHARRYTRRSLKPLITKSEDRR